MYFHPPTFDPGPAALLIGFAALLFLTAQPLLTRPLARRMGEPAEPGRPPPVTRLHHLGVWLSLVEVFAVMAFVASARVVTPADIGLVPPRLHEYDPDTPSLLADDLVSWTGTAVTLVWIALFVAILLVERYGGGAGPARTHAEQPGLSEWTDTDWR
ncbi:hypothetical protein [Nocardiopsis quinghaiensis]|uniref:hypothetical protein n=1 Tax=Nocardiopsis quinghaiensis TaxID=464995 RepID=UPI001CC26395|nr:hypothetical protein [Nocardiopsis quinghaiensis]